MASITNVVGCTSSRQMARNLLKWEFSCDYCHSNTGEEVIARLDLGADGRPIITMHDSCYNTVRALMAEKRRKRPVALQGITY